MARRAWRITADFQPIFWPQSCLGLTEPMLTVMKTFISFTALVLIATSCSFYEVEPRYDDRNRFVGYYDVEEYSATYRDFTY
jgi:hypothetical protein